MSTVPKPLLLLCLIHWLILWQLLPQTLAVGPRFTHVQCKLLDKKRASLTYCRLEPGRNGQPSLSIKIRSFSPVFNDTTGYMRYMKKTSNSQYKLFIAPLKFNVCKFLDTEHNPLLMAAFRMIQPYTNMNHSCPFYEEDLIIDRFNVNSRLLFWLPQRKGDYGMFSTWSVAGVPALSVSLFFNFPEDVDKENVKRKF